MLTQCYIDKFIRLNNKGVVDNNTNSYHIINYLYGFKTAVKRLLSYAMYDIKLLQLVNSMVNKLWITTTITWDWWMMFACYITPLKLNFKISGLFEVSDMFGCYYYTDEQVYSDINTDFKPIIIKIPDDLMLVNEYKTSLSSKQLSIVETIVF